MTYEKIINEIIILAKKNQITDSNGEYIVKMNSLINHFNKKHPSLDSRVIIEVIDEIEARGWLLLRNNEILNFDPTTFN